MDNRINPWRFFQQSSAMERRDRVHRPIVLSDYTGLAAGIARTAEATDMAWVGSGRQFLRAGQLQYVLEGSNSEMLAASPDTLAARAAIVHRGSQAFLRRAEDDAVVVWMHDWSWDDRSILPVYFRHSLIPTRQQPLVRSAVWRSWIRLSFADDTDTNEGINLSCDGWCWAVVRSQTTPTRRITVVEKFDVHMDGDAQSLFFTSTMFPSPINEATLPWIRLGINPAVTATGSHSARSIDQRMHRAPLVEADLMAPSSQTGLTYCGLVFDVQAIKISRIYPVAVGSSQSDLWADTISFAFLRDTAILAHVKTLRDRFAYFERDIFSVRPLGQWLKCYV